MHTKASPDVTTTYILHIVDSAGCEIYDDFQIIVMPTGTETIEAERFKSKIAPHPIFDQSTLSVEGPSNRSYTVIFFNLVGQPVIKSVMPQNEMIVYRKDFTPGIYFYQIATTQCIVATGKMIVN